MIPLSTIRRALADGSVEPPAPAPSVAAVAMVMAGDPDALSLCFILRATREGDRWSGQMALPGGRTDPGDPTTQDVAIRETHEEVGLGLHDAEPLGALSPISLRPTGAVGVLAPFAFYLGPRMPVLRPNDGEVEDAFWIPLSHLWHPDHRTTIDWEHQGQMLRFPGIRYRGHTIWGLTYRVLTQWAERLQRPLPGAGTIPIEPRLRGG